MRFHPAASLCAPLLALALGCGGGIAQSDPGTLNLSLGSDSFYGFQNVWVTVAKVECSGDGSNWATLTSTPRTLDLMALQNGNPASLFTGLSLGAGTINFLRVTWGTVNTINNINLPAYVTDNNGRSNPLTMPASSVFTASIPVVSNATANGQIMVDGSQAVQLRPDATGILAYTFQATGQGCNLGNCCTVSGTLSAGGTVLPGVEVYAETVDSTPRPTVQRRAFTDGNGKFTLQALPLTDGSGNQNIYFAVAQPAGTTSSYPAAASAPIQAAAVTTYPAVLSFGSAAAPGTLALTITPGSTSTQGTWGELLQTLPTGSSGSQTLVVRSQSAATATGLGQDTATFVGLCPGTYWVTAKRSTSGATPTKATSAVQLVNPGATTPVSLSGLQ